MINSMTRRQVSGLPHAISTRNLHTQSPASCYTLSRLDSTSHAWNSCPHAILPGLLTSTPRSPLRGLHFGVSTLAGVSKCVWVRFRWAAGWPGSWACLTFPWAGSVLVATAGEEAGMLVHGAGGGKRQRLAIDGSARDDSIPASACDASSGASSGAEQPHRHHPCPRSHPRQPSPALAASTYFCMLVAATACTAVAGVGAMRVHQRTR